MRQRLFVFTTLAWLTLAALCQAQSRNLIRNGSFESCTNPGIPDGWGMAWNQFVPDYFGECRALPAYWVEKLGQDHIPTWGAGKDTVTDEGKQSLRVKQPGDLVCGTATSRHVKLKKGITYAFSFCMKADKADIPISAGMYGKPYQTFKTTTTWKRYSLVFTPEENRPRERVIFRFTQNRGPDLRERMKKAEQGEVIDATDKATTFWVDAVQLEEAEAPTEYVDGGTW